MSEVFKTIFAGRNLIIKTHFIAEQANGSVLLTYGETVVLVTVVSSQEKKDENFLPLSVDYQEMNFAAGKIPGGFFKREGRPNEREILVSRMIDRSIRPLFYDDYFYETQIIAKVLSLDNENDPDILCILGASIALEISDIPFKGPIAAIRIGCINDKLISNTLMNKYSESTMDIVLTGKLQIDENTGQITSNLVMLEGSALEISEEKIISAIHFGLEEIKLLLELQNKIKISIGKDKRKYEEIILNQDLINQISASLENELEIVYHTSEKINRYLKLDKIKKDFFEKQLDELTKESTINLKIIFEKICKNFLRKMIFNEQKRIDGRKYKDIRNISCETSILPRTHGSALFTRGETQSLAILTLGTSSDEQRLDYISGEELRSFMLHYNFPAYSVGEIKSNRGPGRREIGHGALARKALIPILPSREEFPYTIRIVSEILSSNGSSSMATVCSSILCLMDGGVPVKNIVAGIAMGLMKNNNNDIVILSDILGDEDHAGDMDLKICGTINGITAIQMDIKIDHLTNDILRKAFYQAKEGRLLIIRKIHETLEKPRKEMSHYAPRISILQVKPDKIRDVIGLGGKNIKQIISETGVNIDIEDNGIIKIASNDAKAASRAIAMIQWLTEEAELGKIYVGTIKKIVDFGAFVEILPGTEGLLHISQISKKRVNKVTDILKLGDKITVKVIEIDKIGKIRLSKKETI